MRLAKGDYALLRPVLIELRRRHPEGLAHCCERPHEGNQGGFPQGKDDAFNAVVGLFGMLQVCLGQRAPSEPDEPVIRDIEGWILGHPG
jgi:hypothetical protein